MGVIVSVGSINADFLMRVEEAPAGPGTVLGHELLRTSGGKAANVAVLGRRLGADVRLIGCVGDDDLADQALRGPRLAGVDISTIRRKGGHTGFAAILVAPDGDKTIALAANANDAWAEEADEVADEVATAPAGSVLVVDLEVPVSVVTTAVRAAHRAGLAVVVDPAPPERLAKDLFAQVDHLIPDHREAAALTGIDTGSADGALRAAEACHERGAGFGYVKMAAGGCAVVGEQRAVVEVPSGLDVVDTTGAGDAFAGGLAWALLDGRPPLEAAGMAVAASSCAVEHYGSQESYPTLGQLVARADHLSVTPA